MAKKGFINSLKNINPFGNSIDYLDENGRPKSIVRSSGPKNRGLGGTSRSPSQLKKYWKYYDNEMSVWAAINSIALNTVMVGYHIDSDNEEAKKLINNWCKTADLTSHLLDNVRYALIFGDAFIEIVNNKKGVPSSLHSVDPKTMNIEFDNHGVVQGYEQDIGGFRSEETVNLDREEICHINFFTRPDSPYGISLIEPSKDIIDKKIETDDAIFRAIQRHGTTKTVFTVGSEEDGSLPPDSVLKAIEKEVEDIDSKNEFVVPWNVSVDSIDEKGIAGVEEYYNYFQSQVVIGLLCPEEALGLGRGSTEATSKTKALLFERLIKSFQTKLSRLIEKQLFNKVLKSNGFEEDLVSIEFDSVTEEDEAMKAKWLGNLIRGFRSSKTKPLTINEIRRIMGFKEIDDPQADTITYQENKEASENNEKRQENNP